MGVVIAVLNNKGGVGKTTLTINLGHALANRGRRVLLVDMDSQCNCTSTFFDPGTRRTVADVMQKACPPSKAVAVTDYERLHVIPNAHEIGALEPIFTRNDDFGWHLLRDSLREFVLQSFDVTLLDCPPNLGVFSMQAVIASDFVIVPVEAGSKYAADGLDRTVETVEEIAKIEGSDNSGRFLRLLINKADRRTTICRHMIQQIRAEYPGKVFETTIPLNTDIQQAELVGKTVLRHNPHCLGTKAFRALAQEVLDLTGQNDG